MAALLLCSLRPPRPPPFVSSHPRHERRRRLRIQTWRQDRLIETRIGIRRQSAALANLVVRPQPHAAVERLVTTALLLIARTALGKGDHDIRPIAATEGAGQCLPDQR